MSDVLTKAQRHKCMACIKSKDTSIEVTLRKALWAKGIRYFKNYRKIPGKPDIAITKHKIAVFCDSEFWHGKDWPTLRRKLLTGNNPHYWLEKITRNRKRDREINKLLASLGWRVIRFWGTDITRNTMLCANVVAEAITQQRSVMRG